MLVASMPLAETADALRSGRVDLEHYIETLFQHVEAVEPEVQALVSEPLRRVRLLEQARRLKTRFPVPSERPPLYGIPVGIKDIFHVEGFLTRAGSQLPPHALAVGSGTVARGGAMEAAVVTRLRDAGALILGKTVTTEFAYFGPGPTRNPHDLNHTPGGSSSGSAAAVAAGMCPLAVGTQTIGSVIRPAAFCGIVGFKPSYGRIPTDGLILFSASADHVGLFTQDVAGMELAAAVVCDGWQQPSPSSQEAGRGGGRADRRLVLGVPEGAYLEQASDEGLAAFGGHLMQLEDVGYSVHRVPVLDDIAGIAKRHRQLIAAEIAHVHAAWFDRYRSLYRPRTVEIILEGQAVSAAALSAGRASQMTLRRELQANMSQAGIDLWVTPAAPGPAPQGIGSTGDPAMNLPWTHAGMPAVTLPAGRAANGLPLGLQCVAPFMADERLLLWASELAAALETRP
jgi:Asp-tRNA(Asn)/Glu-tRNA(Gln) amidotransferase A subunit family amidase